MKEQYEESERRARWAVAKKPDAETGHYLLGRALFAAGAASSEETRQAVHDGEIVGHIAAMFAHAA
jgi:hypothetical protein